MQALAARSQPRRHRRWLLVAVLIVVVALVAGAAYALGRRGTSTGSAAGHTGSAPPPAGRKTSTGGSSPASGDPLTVVSTTPANGAKGVAANATLTVAFSGPLAAHSPQPSLTPPVSGKWVRSGAKSLVFHPSASFIPGSSETLSVPGGAGGVAGTGGAHLAATVTVPFTVATGSTLRLQQLLAELGYLPLAYTTPGPPPPQDMAQPQPGTLSWRWSSLPFSLVALWTQGYWGIITKGAVMTFESQNGITVDGLPGPKVWATLMADVAAKKGNATPYSYVHVTKTLPEHLTLWVNGALQMSNVPVNTGAPGANTTDGTFAVFEHVRASDMKGTNPTGSTYNDPTVPWASFFNGGDALHGFVRAQYGFPQSNGCVEMPITLAAKVWPYTPIGTLVTVDGPPPAGTPG